MKNCYKGIFKNYFLIIVALISTITIIVSCSLFYQYSKVLSEKSKNQNLKVIEKARLNIVSMDEIAEQILHSLYSNYSIKSCIYADPRQALNRTSALSIMDTYHIMDYVQSIYLYNGAYKVFVDSIEGSITPFYMFYDKKSLDLYHTNKSESTFLVRVPRIVEKKGLKQNVFTYGIFEKNDEGSIESAVILNLKKEWLAQQIEKLENNDATNIIIISKEGEMIHGIETEYLNIIKQEPYIKIFEKINFKKKIFEYYDKESKYVYLIKQLDSIDWILLSKTSYSLLFSEIIKLRRFTIYITMVLFFLSFIIAFILTKRLYRPLYRIKAILPLPIKETLFQKENELEVILNSIERIISENKNHVVEQERENQYIYESNIIKYLNKELIKEVQSINEIDVNSEIYSYMITFRWDRNYISEEDKDLYRFVVKKIIQEILNNNRKIVLTDKINDKVFVMMNATKTKDIENPYLLFDNQIIKVVEIMKKHFSVVCCIAKAYVIESGKNLQMVYNDLLEISNCFFMYPNKIIMGCDFLKNKDRLIDVNQFIDNEMINAIIKKDKMLFNEKLENFIEHIRVEKYDNVAIIISNLVYRIYDKYNQTMISEKSILILWRNLQTIENYSSIVDIKNDLEELVRKIIEKIEIEEKNNQTDIVDLMIEYIKEHYREKNLCLNEVAEYYDMSSVYLGRKFRDRERQSFSNYLMEYRLNAVGELIRNGESDLNSILDAVGIVKSNYFYTVFKKHFGTPLSVYKRKYR